MEKVILFEDEHLLVVHKPAGVNTHAPNPFAGEGIYEWLKNREPRWSDLAIIHRLDKETSGIIVFGKTSLANRSLTAQFESRSVRKKYILVTDREVRFENLSVKSSLVRAGEKYLSRPLHAGSDQAETIFRKIEPRESLPTVVGKQHIWIEAEPVTGKTHQIRVHAAERGFPILGDVLYGGSAADRLYLQAAELTLKHTVTEEELTFAAPLDFATERSWAVRGMLIDSQETNAFRVIHGAADGHSGWYVDRLGEFLLSQSERPLDEKQKTLLKNWMQRDSLRGVYHKTLTRHVRGVSAKEASPELIFGEPSAEEILIRENSVQFTLRFHEGYSVGLFLDQRENRRRFLSGYIAAKFPRLKAGEVLNAFAYTCGFSVCAAKSGARVTSLDLSKKYLEWGKRNFDLNAVSSAGHDFIYGDAFDWLRRLGKKGRTFDVVVLDPPTFSQSKEHGVFRAEKDFGKLVEAALPVLKSGGILFASTNASELKSEKFLEMVQTSVASKRRRIVRQHYAPQPPDFPMTRDEPGYLKTLWLQVE